MSSTRPDALPRKKPRGRLKLRNAPREAAMEATEATEAIVVAEVVTEIEMVIAAMEVVTGDMVVVDATKVAMIVLETKCTILGPGMEEVADITGE